MHPSKLAPERQQKGSKTPHKAKGEETRERMSQEDVLNGHTSTRTHFFFSRRVVEVVCSSKAAGVIALVVVGQSFGI